MSGRRVVGYGYRFGEVKLPELPPVKSSAKVKFYREVDLTLRPPVQCSMGPILMGAAMPHPDPHDPKTMLAGVSKRFAVKPPDADSESLDELRTFVKKWLQTNLTPLAPDTDVSIPTWLDGTSYPAWRKEELRNCNPDNINVYNKKKWWRCKSFQKDETYPDYKHPRGINSRSDQFKCAVGPIFKCIEKVLFKHRSFIKRIPVVDRPQYIRDLLQRAGAKYIATDYTSFEALFTEELMRAVEFQLYEYMTSELPSGSEFMRLMYEVLGGDNICEFKNFMVTLKATRMSGEMCTSLGNGFSNLMFLLYLCDKHDIDVEAVIEGDDCLARLERGMLSANDFAKLGLNIKLEQHDSLSEASFCGLIFDEEELLNVTDPREVLASFGWAQSKYCGAKQSKLLSLLRCKSLSLAYQYPGCPIIASLARYGLRVTRSHDVRHMVQNWRNTWEREQLLEAISHPVINVPVGTRTRLLVEKLYGITVSQQLLTEELLDSKADVLPFTVPFDFPVPWQHYFNAYVLDNENNRPSVLWPQVTSFAVTIPLSVS